MNKLATFLRESGPAIIFIPVGIILIFFGIIMFVVNNNRNYIETKATVSKTELIEESHTDADGNTIEAPYHVYVKYTVDGVKYEEELGELTGYKKGNKLTIYYNPDNPKQITQTKSMILLIIFIIGGCAALVGGIISAINAIKNFKKMKNQEKECANAK